MFDIVHDVEVEVAGVNRQGSYWVEGGQITVFCDGFRKTTQLGDSLPASLARAMLSEFFDTEQSD